MSAVRCLLVGTAVPPHTVLRVCFSCYTVNHWPRKSSGSLFRAVFIIVNVFLIGYRPCQGRVCQDPSQQHQFGTSPMNDATHGRRSDAFHNSLSAFDSAILRMRKLFVGSLHLVVDTEKLNQTQK